MQALVAKGVDIKEGDEVRIELAPRNLLRASWLVYGVPLTAAVLTAAVAYLLDFGDIAAVFAATAGLAVGLVIARGRLRTAGCLRDFTPTIVERYRTAR